MLETTGRVLTVLVTEPGAGGEDVIGRLDFPVYRAARRVLGRDVPGTEREVLGNPASPMAMLLAASVWSVVEAKGEQNRRRFELFSREWVINDLMPALRAQGFGAHGPYDVTESAKLTFRSREPLADGLRRVGLREDAQPVSVPVHGTAIGSFIHRV